MIEWLVLGLFALAGGSSSSPVVIVAQPWGGGGGVQPPPPPKQGDGFRTGAQPDPAAPDDPGRGRYFAELGQSKYEGHSAEHVIPVVQIHPQAQGKITVEIWASRKGKPERCTKWGSTIVVKDGRAQLPGGWSVPQKCGEKDVTNTAGDGCTMPLPQLQWEQAGPLLQLLWTTRVNGNAEQSDNDCDGHLSFYVDVLWRFE